MARSRPGLFGAAVVLAAGAFASAQPVITSVSPNAGRPGDTSTTITITGSGFAQFFSENLVTFNGRPVSSVTSGTADTITVTVPFGATTGPLEVRVGTQLSNGFPFTVFPAGGFVNLSGININTSSESPHVFVSDSGAAVGASLIELDPFTIAGFEWAKAPHMGIANIRGLPLSFDSRFYFSNASLNNANQGTMSYWDPNAGTFGIWPRGAGTAGTDPVACVAMGTSQTNSDFLFFADRRNNQIRRVGGLLLRTYASGFSFTPDFSGTVAGFRGLAFDNNGTIGTFNFGDLYVSSGGNIVRVRQNNPPVNPDDTTSTTVVSGLSTPAGLYFDENRTLHIADPGANTIGLYHSPTNTYEQRLTGLSTPRMATLGRTDDTPVETKLYIAEPTRVVMADDQRVDMSPRENIQALISNCPEPLLTPGCAGTPYPTVYQDTAGLIQIEARLHPPRAGVTIYFDIEDPRDTAPYATSGQNDNLDGPGSLIRFSDVTDATGKATTALRITERFAGDNYRVRARLGSTTDPVVAKTGIITAWKRLFVEQDRMFRERGQFLDDVEIGATVLTVMEDTLRFVVGDTILIFDTDNQIPDVRTVQALTTTTITLNEGTTRAFSHDKLAYAGRFADGFYEADLGKIHQTYDDAFVEVVFRSDGSAYVPWTSQNNLSDQTEYDAFSARWFKNGRELNDLTNYIHVVGIDHYLFMGDPGFLGVTGSDKNYSFVAHGAITEAYGMGSPLIPPAQRSTTSHEFGHQFGLPEETALRRAWCGTDGDICSGTICLMDSGRNRTNDIYELEEMDMLSGDQGIRKIADPI